MMLTEDMVERMFNNLRYIFVPDGIHETLEANGEIDSDELIDRMDHYLNTEDLNDLENAIKYLELVEKFKLL